MSKGEVEVKCIKCGKPMTSGKIHACGSELSWLCWLEDKEKGRRWWQGIGKVEQLESKWKPKGLRAYRCKECGIIICYENKPLFSQTKNS
jgi:DNA-directed RNA polymerase subunit RPC12/RpoP